MNRIIAAQDSLTGGMSMHLTLVPDPGLNIGDLVTVKSMSPDERFCIIGFKNKGKGQPVAVLKALFNDTYIIEKPVSELNHLLIKGLL